MIPKVGLHDAIKTLFGGGGNGPYTGMYIHLIKAPITVTPAVVVGDLTEADYAGYASQIALPVGTTFDDAQGNIIQLFAGKVFTPTAGTTPNVIYGWYGIAQADAAPAPAIILQLVMFEVPVNLADALDTLPIWPWCSLGQPIEPIDLTP